MYWDTDAMLLCCLRTRCDRPHFNRKNRNSQTGRWRGKPPKAQSSIKLKTARCNKARQATRFEILYRTAQTETGGLFVTFSCAQKGGQGATPKGQSAMEVIVELKLGLNQNHVHTQSMLRGKNLLSC